MSKDYPWGVRIVPCSMKPPFGKFVFQIFFFNFNFDLISCRLVHVTLNTLLYLQCTVDSISEKTVAFGILVLRHRCLISLWTVYMPVIGPAGYATVNNDPVKRPIHLFTSATTSSSRNKERRSKLSIIQMFIFFILFFSSFSHHD